MEIVEGESIRQARASQSKTGDGGLHGRATAKPTEPVGVGIAIEIAISL